jgi:chromosomal replication initiator protein
MAQRQLADLLTGAGTRNRTDDDLLAEIAEILGVTIEALKSKGRQRPLVTLRQIAMYVIREMTDSSYPTIARLFGGRDHTTVMHAVRTIEDRTKLDQKFHAEVGRIEQEILQRASR